MRALFPVLVLVTSQLAFSQTPSTFPPLEQWRDAVLKADPAVLKSLYSSWPAVQVSTTKGKVDTDADIAFWTGLKARSLAIKVAEAGSPQPGVELFTLQVKVVGAGERTTNIVEGQAWQNQAGTWRLVGVKRDIAKLEQPASTAEKLYPTGDAHEQIRDAVARAQKAHKNILVVFGADWCYDCHVLDKAFHRTDVAAVLDPNYELVDIDVGEGDKNQDLMNEYQVPMQRGIPAIAILDAKGNLIYSQKNGEWERARALGPQDLIALLSRWKPGAK
ncbi:MAG TPA: thioredoxin family protein [Terriglobales bacterium]